MREGTIFSNGFFCSVSFGRKYVHRRELRGVLLGNPSSAQYGIKESFCFSLFTGSYHCVKILWKVDWNPLFLLKFCVFHHIFLTILQNYENFVNKNFIDLTFRDKRNWLICFIWVFWLIFFAKYSSSAQYGIKESFWNPSSAQYGIKESFCFSLFTGSYHCVKILWKVDWNPLFLLKFCVFHHIFLTILQNYENFVNKNFIDLTFRDKRNWLICFIWVFWLIFFAKFF